MVLTQNEAAASLNEQTVHRIARLYRIVRQDGVIIRATDHNASIVFNGDTYSTARGVYGSNRRRDAGLKPSNEEWNGFLSIDSSDFTDEDLAAGLYDGCRVDIWEVDWKFPWAVYSSSIHFIDQVTFDGEKWQASAEGVASLLTRRVGKKVSKECHNDVGDAICGFDFSGDVFVGTGSQRAAITPTSVTAVNSALQLQVSAFLTNYTYPSGKVDKGPGLGRALWTSGANTGTWSRIARYTNDGVTPLLTLMTRTGKDVQVGDTLDLYEGCGRNSTICQIKFNRFDSFRGFEMIPLAAESINPV